MAFGENELGATGEEVPRPAEGGFAGAEALQLAERATATSAEGALSVQDKLAQLEQRKQEAFARLGCAVYEAARDHGEFDGAYAEHLQELKGIYGEIEAQCAVLGEGAESPSGEVCDGKEANDTNPLNVAQCSEDASNEGLLGQALSFDVAGGESIVAPETICENCGTPFEPWQAFCLECGQPVRAQVPAADSAPFMPVPVALQDPDELESAPALGEDAEEAMALGDDADTGALDAAGAAASVSADSFEADECAAHETSPAVIPAGETVVIRKVSTQGGPQVPTPTVEKDLSGFDRAADISPFDSFEMPVLDPFSPQTAPQPTSVLSPVPAASQTMVMGTVPPAGAAASVPVGTVPKVAQASGAVPAAVLVSPAQAAANSWGFCPQCGAQLTPDSLFCGNCGIKLH